MTDRIFYRYRSKRQSSGRSRRRRSGDRAPPPVKVELARNGEDETDLSGEGTSIEKVGVEVTRKHFATNT